MNRNELNRVLRKFVQNNLSPTVAERRLVTKIYAALQDVLGVAKCLQIGSYPRFTAITPLHDLDVLYRVGEWPGHTPNPAELLHQIKLKIEREFQNPTAYDFRVDLQTHSITIAFLHDSETVLSVDVVPGYSIGLNQFREEMYMVPELLVRRPAQRRTFYEELERAGRSMNWIKSDPRGYITAAALVNDQNDDFRKSAKLVKAWKWACKEQNDDFKLKSFHIEQVLTIAFQQQPALEIADAALQFFANLHRIVDHAQIPDRADNNKYIDEYVNDLTSREKQAIVEAGRWFLQELQTVMSEADLDALLSDTAQRALKARRFRRSSNNSSRAATASAGFVPKSPWRR